jgi:hypothetical protein
MGLEEPRGELCAKGRESPLEDPERTDTAAFRCSRWPWPHLRGVFRETNDLSRSTVEPRNRGYLGNAGS